MPSDRSNDFLSRFDAVVRAYRRMSLLRVMCWTLLVVLIAFAAVAAIDYLFEVGRTARSVATMSLLVATGVAIAVLALRVRARTTEQHVASELEGHFPELGQSVRTSVQFRRPDPHDGASQSLLAAMNRDVADRSTGLPLDQAVPTARFYRAAMLLTTAAIVLVVLAATSWQWRMATLRALFGNQAYTEVEAAPGDTTVEEGASLKLIASVQGRVHRPTTLMTRPLSGDRATWTTQELSDINVTERAARRVVYEVDLPDIREPLEYRVVAGPYRTRAHRVQVRHPLEIKSIRIEVQPPAYTGLSSVVVDEGSFHAVAGSTARFQFTLDRPADSASIVLSARDRRVAAADESELTVPLSVEGNVLTAELELTYDMLYSIEGLAADGSDVRQNRYRIRVREDRPPRIDFEQPPVEIEVHSLAEMVMRARVEDDYGLTRAGVVFQVNNGPEYPLVLREFEVEESQDANRSDDSERANNVTRADLEKVLPLEPFELTQKDSITYYAFAEDNAPGGPRRVQTDLQFIDIRPFRRLYRFMQGGGGGGGGGGGPQLASLEELISRERFILNRSLRLARAEGNGQQIDLDDVDQIVRLQQETAELTRELADAVAEFEDEEGITDERVSDLFYSAEEAMLAAMDSLSVGNYDTASLQERDAVRYLVEGRNRIEVLIGQGGGGALRRLFQANRRLLQKLRRPETDVERAAEAARMLRSLADREEDVQDELSEMLREAMEAAQSDAEGGQAGRRRRREIEDKQMDISLDVEMVDEVVQEIEGVTELTRTRSAESVEMASAVTGALERGSTDEAAGQAENAAAMFRELADQLEGVTALEPAGRIAVARDLASRVAVDLRTMRSGLADRRQAWQDVPDGTETAAEQAQAAEELSNRTSRLVDSTGTIEDILNSVVETFSAETDPAAAQVERLLAENELPHVAEQLLRLDQLFHQQTWQDADLEMAGVADRADGLAQRLDAIHRSLVAPRIEQLRAFELRAVELAESLAQLNSEGHITRWHQKADGLLEDLAIADVQLASTEKLREAMETAGWNGAAPPRWNWVSGAGNTFVPPEAHVVAMQDLITEIQRYIQELIVGGIYAADADAVPPEYIHFVRRYMEALSQDSGP